MKKIFTTLCVFAGLMLTACNSTNNESKPGKSSENGSNPTPTDCYQFEGKLEEGGSFASFTDAAYLLNLDVDGTSTLSKYGFASYDASPAATNSSYTASFMSGTWKAVTKEGVDCLQIKLAFVNEDGTEENAGTYYAYDSDGVYSVDLTLSLIKGQSFTRTVSMTGQKDKKYADADAFIQAYKLEFVEPTNIVKVESKEHGGAAYFTEDGKVMIYVDTNKVADGTYVKAATSLKLVFGETEIPVTLSMTNATFTYTYDMAGYTTFDLVFEMPIADFSKLPVNEQGGGGEDPEPITDAVAELKDEANSATLTFNKDNTYAINMGFGGYGSYDVQKGTWAYANYVVTLTPEGGAAYTSSVSGGKFIIETHVNWGGGAIDKDLHFEADQTILGKFTSGGQQEEPVNTAVAELKDEANSATLTFNKDKTYAINMGFGGYGSYDVQKGTWAFAGYSVTCTPENGTAFSSTVNDGKFIIETHVNWGGGAIDKDLHFEADQTIIGNFMAA